MKLGFELYPSGTVMPRGWLLNQMKIEMERGLIGQFDTIDATVSQNLFAENKRDHGYVPPYHKTTAAKDWWSGEHEGYWKDAFIRGAFYSGDPEKIAKAKEIVRQILDVAKENDGYIGIYTKTSRYNNKLGPDNGELWAQSRILLALLAYFDFTHDQKVMDAVIRAVNVTITNFSPDENYFNGNGGGIGHGLMLVDVCEELYNRTQDSKYIEFVELLYGQYSQAVNKSVRYYDMQKGRVLSSEKYKGHGVHTTEHLRVPIFLYKLKPTEENRQVFLNAVEKLKYHSVPSGTLVCDEQVKGRKGSPDLPYEYCSIVEQFTSLQSAVVKWGEEQYIDWAEKIYFNPGFANRLPDYSAVTYLATDNRYHTKEGQSEKFLYSARHAAAACCVLNGGRLTPLYIRGMWMKHEKTGLPAAVFFGPSELQCEYQGKQITITQETDFPFNDSIQFKVPAGTPEGFAFYIRKPAWAIKEAIDVIGGTYELEGTFWKITPEQGKVTNVTINLEAAISYEALKKKHICIRRGPIYFAYPIPTTVEPVRELGTSGFHTYYTQASKIDVKKVKNYRLQAKTVTSLSYHSTPWNQVDLIWKDPHITLDSDIQLIPMGCTTLRRLSFKLKGKLPKQE